VKHRARLLAKGYVQKHEIDFEEVFALVARMELVRVMPQLRTGTMASSRKLLRPRATRLSLLLRHYSGSTMTSAARRYYGV
jgi:hypothetical protein